MKTGQIDERKHAIVMGASMAGLLAARVLSGFYAEVTLVERDTLPSGGENRRGVPQGRHTHGLLASGCQTIERFFPGISEILAGGGAVTADIVRDSRWFFQGDCLSRPTSGLTGLLLTRPMLEAAVRERVLALPNLRKRDGCSVASLVTTDDNERVTGVELDGGEVLSGDLVVDATGRGSQTPRWLMQIGYEDPREEKVKVALGYATRFFRRFPGDLNGDVAVIIPPTPEGKRGGVMVAQEGDRWTVTLISHFGNYPPDDLDGFIEFARTLPAPFIHEIVRRAEPLGEGVSVRFPASVRRRYEEIPRFPTGYLVVGDAVCSFNPVYGQGMSVAALEAAELERTLAENPEDLAKQFFARAAKVVNTPWSIAVGNDLRMPETIGPRTLGAKFINWYISKLHKAGHTDAECSLAFHRVANLVAASPSILHPRIALRVLWRNLTAGPGRTESEPQRAAAAAE